MKTKQTQDQSQVAKKPGIFSRIVNKMDNAMKAKAEEKTKESSCCGGNGKGDKCC